MGYLNVSLGWAAFQLDDLVACWFTVLRLLLCAFCLRFSVCLVRYAGLRCRLSCCVGLVDWFWAGVVRVLLICWGLVCWVVCCVWYCGFAVFADCSADGGVLVGVLRFVIV